MPLRGGSGDCACGRGELVYRPHIIVLRLGELLLYFSFSVVTQKKTRKLAQIALEPESIKRNSNTHPFWCCTYSYLPCSFSLIICVLVDCNGSTHVCMFTIAMADLAGSSGVLSIWRWRIYVRLNFLLEPCLPLKPAFFVSDWM